ncbi:MAG: GNAT family N-acetyltransferase [Limosilactobacillus mucosae]|nr:GNAT family N-acetyltransferase [Limosilactobacillus mucosae]
MVYTARSMRHGNGTIIAPIIRFNDTDIFTLSSFNAFINRGTVARIFLMYGNEIVGTATLMTQGDAHYMHIVNGQWNRPGHPFATIHRVAISGKYRGKHFANYIMSHMITLAYDAGVRNFRIATHDKNDRVHNLVQNFGFVKRGQVYTGPTDRDLRNVYELNLD